MSVRERALTIGLMGPAICMLGLVWVLLTAVLDGTPRDANLRFFIFSAPHLAVFVGVIISFVGVPLAISVAMASEEEVRIPQFEAEAATDEPREPAPASDYTWLPK